MKDKRKILVLTVTEKNEEIEFCIDTDVPLTKDECNKIIKIYHRAFARMFNFEKEKIEKIEKMKPTKFKETKY